MCAAPLATEQAALRRVATLVASGVSPDELFERVAEEVGRLLGADITTRSDSTRTAGRSSWPRAGAEADRIPVGTAWDLEGPWVTTTVWQTAARRGSTTTTLRVRSPRRLLRRAGVRSSVASPVVVEGRRWGAMVVSSRDEPLPPGTEGRMADFTELIAVAIANAEARTDLRRMVEEQSALRRVATLVAQAGSPSLVFEAVTGGRLLFDAESGPDGAL